MNALIASSELKYTSATRMEEEIFSEISLRKLIRREIGVMHSAHFIILINDVGGYDEG
jgi:hypothetical protein